MNASKTSHLCFVGSIVLLIAFIVDFFCAFMALTHGDVEKVFFNMLPIRDFFEFGLLGIMGLFSLLALVVGTGGGAGSATGVAVDYSDAWRWVRTYRKRKIAAKEEAYAYDQRTYKFRIESVERYVSQIKEEGY